MDASRAALLARTAAIMEDIFGIVPEKVTPQSSPDTIPQWDSLKHISLISALEEEFNFQFTPDEMSEMLNVDIILDILFEKSSSATTRSNALKN